MLEKLEVYQQPAGFVDNIIFSWIAKGQAQWCSASVEQRDLFASPIRECGKAIARLSHQIQTFIAGKTTSALQLTDTHWSFLVQSAVKRAKERIKKEMRQKAEKDGKPKPIGFKAGPYEVLRIAFEAHEHMEKVNEEKNYVVRGMRENYMLSHRPNLRTGKMERCDTQAWCQKKDEEGKVECKFPEGTHRIKKQWAENRYSWLGEDGRPEQPEWQRCGKAVHEPEDMEDATAHGEPGCKVKLQSWAEDEDLKDGVEEAAIVIEDDSGIEDV